MTVVVTLHNYYKCRSVVECQKNLTYLSHTKNSQDADLSRNLPVEAGSAAGGTPAGRAPLTARTRAGLWLRARSGLIPTYH